LPGLPRDKVLALVVSVLAETLIRVGNHEYARQNNSFGLTTLRNRHVRFPRGAAIFEFRGKSGKDHVVEFEDEGLAKLLRRCQQLPGQKLFQYLDEQGVPRPIGSGDVNDYLREACGEDFTAKDFRTWGGTLAAIKELVRAPPPEDASERTLAMLQNAAVKEVARQLGNTPAVCRASYIHPAVFAGWRDGRLGQSVPEGHLSFPRKLERHALRFLEGALGRGLGQLARHEVVAQVPGRDVDRSAGLAEALNVLEQNRLGHRLSARRRRAAGRARGRASRPARAAAGASGKVRSRGGSGSCRGRR